MCSLSQIIYQVTWISLPYIVCIYRKYVDTVNPIFKWIIAANMNSLPLSFFVYMPVNI